MADSRQSGAPAGMSALDPKKGIKYMNAHLPAQSGTFFAFQETYVAFLNLLSTLRTTAQQYIEKRISAKQDAAVRQDATASSETALSAGDDAPRNNIVPFFRVQRTQELPPADRTRSIPELAPVRTPDRLSSDVHRETIAALEATFANSALVRSVNDNTAAFRNVGAAIAGAGFVSGGRDHNENRNQALNDAGQGNSRLAERLAAIARKAETAQSEAVVDMGNLLSEESARLQDSWPQIAAAAAANPRLRSVLDLAVMRTVDRSASNG